MSKPAASQYEQDFARGPLTMQAVEAARGDWQKHDSGWAGMLNKGARIGKDSTAAIMGASATIPGLGWLAEVPETAIYGTFVALDGLTRTFMENKAVEAAGGTKENKGGVGRVLLNTAKSAIPFVN